MEKMKNGRSGERRVSCSDWIFRQRVRLQAFLKFHQVDPFPYQVFVDRLVADEDSLNAFFVEHFDCLKPVPSRSDDYAVVLDDRDSFHSFLLAVRSLRQPLS